MKRFRYLTCIRPTNADVVENYNIWLDAIYIVTKKGGLGVGGGINATLVYQFINTY